MWNSLSKIIYYSLKNTEYNYKQNWRKKLYIFEEMYDVIFWLRVSYMHIFATQKYHRRTVNLGIGYAFNTLLIFWEISLSLYILTRYLL